MEIKVFDHNMFDALDARAKDSPRRRSNENVHESYDAVAQRLFITLYPDSYVRPHKHIETNKWEFFLMIKGTVSFLLFDDDGVCIERMELSSDGDVRGCEIPPNVWHCVVPNSEPATFFEVKEGPYTAVTDKGFAPWSPEEGGPDVEQFLTRLKRLKIDECMRGNL